MKYIVMSLEGLEEIFAFPRTVDHDRMVEACEVIRFGRTNWNRKYMGEGRVVAAGFIDNGRCHGRSETLNLKSREEIDTALLNNYLE